MGIPSAPQDFFSAATNERITNEKPFEWEIGGDVSVGKLVRQQYGDDVVDHVVSALLGGVYSCVADDLGLRATLPHLAAALDTLAKDGPVTLSAAIKQIESGRSPAEGSVFGTFKGGYAELYEALAEKSGAQIHLDTFISGVTRKGDAFEVKGAPGDLGPFDRVLFATPAPTTARLIKAVAPDAAEHLSTIQLASSVVIGFNFASATDPEGNALPDATGILIASDEPDLRAKAFTLSSNKWPHLGEREGFLVRASFGRFGDDALVRADEGIVTKASEGRTHEEAFAFTQVRPLIGRERKGLSAQIRFVGGDEDAGGVGKRVALWVCGGSEVEADDHRGGKLNRR